MFCSAKKAAAWGVARSLVNPVEAEWKLTTGYLGDHPADYGNASLFNEMDMPGGSIEQFLSEQGMPVIWVYGLPGEDKAFVFTVDQVSELSKFKK